MTDLRPLIGKHCTYRSHAVRCLNYLFLFCCLLNSCSVKTDQKMMQSWKQEVLETEKEFAELVGKEGIHKAFVLYAAEDAVLMRNNELIRGKKNIDIFYAGQFTRNLKWTVEFVDVSASGDMAYTYGHYSFTSVDQEGLKKEDRGVFHTVWKRQEDGSWKFVYD